MLNWVYGYAILLRERRERMKEKMKKYTAFLPFQTDGEASFFLQYLHKVEKCSTKKTKMTEQYGFEKMAIEIRETLQL